MGLATSHTAGQPVAGSLLCLVAVAAQAVATFRAWVEM